MSAPDAETRGIERPDLLRAKLHRPRVTRDLVVRPRLLKMLNGGLDGRLILVSAPAGFGKTTLISSWLDGMAVAGAGGTTPVPAAWLSLDEHDNSLAVFVHYFVAALRTLFPDAGSETLALLQALQELPMADLSIMLSNEIEVLPTSFVLVLDDYHLLNGQAIHEFLDGLIYHWPGPLCLVLISRADPPLPLASLRARGKLTEIRTADLRFNTEETAAYLGQVVEMPLRNQEYALLDQYAEGWITALRLAALSLRTPGKIETIPLALAKAGKSIADYMQDEVLAQQVPAIQMFLIKTSVLDRFCSPLCAAVVEQSDPAWNVRACIDWIERADLFLIPLDDRREWYRYHPLFRDFLKKKLLEWFGPEVADDLHHKASAWFGKQGLLRDAVWHALEAGDFEPTARLIERGLCDELPRGPGWRWSRCKRRSIWHDPAASCGLLSTWARVWRSCWVGWPDNPLPPSPSIVSWRRSRALGWGG